MSATVAETAKVAKLDYVELAHKLDNTTRSSISKNDIFQIIIDGSGSFEDRMQRAINCLMRDLDKPITSIEDITQREKEIDRRKALGDEFNLFVQAVRRQEAERQAQLLTEDASIDLQNALMSSTKGLTEISDAMARPMALAGYLEKFGAAGNIIEQMAKAQQQVQERVARLSEWTLQKSKAMAISQSEVAAIDADIVAHQIKRNASANGRLTRFFGAADRLKLDAELANLQTTRKTAQEKLDALRVSVPDPSLSIPEGDEKPIDEDVLRLQDISGPEFGKTVIQIRDLIIHNLAKISYELDAAIAAMRKSQAAYQEMDRNATDADFSLTVLQMAVKESEKRAREITIQLKNEQTPIDASAEQTSEQAMASLERMEKERYAREMQSYTTYLKDFSANLNLAITSVRQGQASLQNKMRIQNLHIQSATTHKVTALANSSEAATIMILSIVDMCNQAAARGFTDESNAIRNIVDKGNKRAAQSAADAQQIHNDQVREFISSTRDIIATMKEVSARSVDLLKEHEVLNAELGKQSDTLHDATKQADSVHFDATAGLPTPPSETPDEKIDAPADTGAFGLRNRRA